eukprot:IDg3975t1
MRTYLKYRCPKPGCPVGFINFIDKSGYKNPYAHLKSCYAPRKSKGEQEEVLHRMYNDARLKMKRYGRTIRSHFEANALSDYEKAMYSYIRLIVMKNMPYLMSKMKMCATYTTLEHSRLTLQTLSVRMDSTTSTQKVVRQTLIALSPMGHISEEGKCEDEDEATTFNAKTHLQFFVISCSFYGQDL